MTKIAALLDWIDYNFIPSAEKESTEIIRSCRGKEVENFTISSNSELLIVDFTNGISLVLEGGQMDTDDIYESHEPNYRTCRARLALRGE